MPSAQRHNKHKMSVIPVKMSESVNLAPGAPAAPGAPHFLFWPTVVALAITWGAGVPLDHPALLWISVLVILMGGLPHGGYDMAVFMKLHGTSTSTLFNFLALYLALAAAMILLWQYVPVAALGVFLTLSIIHFGDDWAELPDGLLRICAGAAIIAAPAIGQYEGVEYFFTAMGGDEAKWIAKLAMICAPVILIVALAAAGIAWKMGEQQRALALVTVLIILLCAPPLIGFAFFFTLLHAPRHMKMVQSVVNSRQLRISVSAIALAILSVCLWALLISPPPTDQVAATGAWAFQLLSVLVVPHLAFSTWAEKHLLKTGAD
jgi:beta-carotene 15,15'-dioxygenase